MLIITQNNQLKDKKKKKNPHSVTKLQLRLASLTAPFILCDLWIPRFFPSLQQLASQYLLVNSPQTTAASSEEETHRQPIC